MLKVENVDVFGWRAAIRGMRNPMNSWVKSDSSFIADGEFYDILGSSGPAYQNEKDGDMVLGSNDLELMKKLIAAGTEHRKFLRMIHIQMDIVAPLYWWKEFDTYKVGTTANSCSTMHKIAANEFTLDDFSSEHLFKEEDRNIPGIEKIHGVPVCVIDEDKGVYVAPFEFYNHLIDFLNYLRTVYLVTKDKRIWWQMIQLLPSSYNQRRTIDFDYETAMNIIRQRTGHKLDEWHVFVDELMKLPCMEEFVKEEK